MTKDQPTGMGDQPKDAGGRSDRSGTEPKSTGRQATGTGREAKAIGQAGHERHVAKALLSLAGGEVAGKLATLVTLAWSARVIGVEAFGVFTFGMGLGVLVATIPSLSPVSRMIQLVGSRVETLGVRLAALNVLRLSFTVPAMIIALPFVFMRPEAVDRWTIALMVLSCLLDNTIKVWWSACTALDRQAATALVLVGQRLTTLALVAAALLTAPSSATVAAAFAIGSFLANIAMMILARRFGAHTDYRAMTRVHLKEMLVATPVSGGNSVLTEMLGRLDVILIGLIAGDAAVGLYGVAYRLMETALFVSWTLSRALTPDLVRSRVGAELAQPVRLGLVLLFGLYVPYGAVLALAGTELSEVIFGSAYETGGVLLLLSAAPLLFGIAHLGTETLFARRPDPVVPLATGVALVVNLLLNVLLLGALGAEGAALAKTVAFAVQAVILSVAVVRIAPPRGWARGALVAVGATAVAIIPVVLDFHILPSVLVAGAIYCPVWYILVRRFDPGMADWIGRARGGGRDEE